MLPITNDTPAGKVRKLSPKKKNTSSDMVTATLKPATKRRPKVKNCVNSDGIVNGFPTVAITAPTSTPAKAKSDFNPYAECFDGSPFSSKFNNFIRPKPPHAATAPVSNHLAAKFASKNGGDAELSRKRLASLFGGNGGSNGGGSSDVSITSKYEMLNHLRPAGLSNHLNPSESLPSSSNASYSRPQPQLTAGTGEVNSKTSPNNLTNRNKVATSYLQMSVKSGEKESEYRNYLPSSAPSASSTTTTTAAVVKPEIRFLDSRKIVELQQQMQQQLSNDKKVCEPSSSAASSTSSKLYLRAKRRKQSRNKWQMDSGTRHEALQRIRDTLDVQDKLQNDLFPLSKRLVFYNFEDTAI